MSTKKLIAFDDRQIEKLEKYCDETKVSFTQAVNEATSKWNSKNDSQVELKLDFDRMMNEIGNLSDRINKIEEDKKFWNADETASQVGNLETQVDEMGKKLNVVVAISKKLKGHLDNRGIHLQDQEKK